MSKHLLSVVTALLLVGCSSAADTLRDGSWKVAKWTYAVDEVFDGHANMPATKSTNTASAENAGTLKFTGGKTVEPGGGGQLARSFTQKPSRIGDEAKFTSGTYNDEVTWDPGGVKGEPNMISIYDGEDPSWDGTWIMTGGGTEVTLTRTYQEDESPTQHIVFHHTLVLKR